MQIQIKKDGEEIKANGLDSQTPTPLLAIGKNKKPPLSKNDIKRNA